MTVIPVAISIAVTPSCINAAYQFRGYRAVGGEYLIIPLGLLAVYFIIVIAKFTDYIKKDQGRKVK